jgi:chorismate synthase
VTTPRNEADRVRILSGVFEGRTTGAPLAMIVENRDQDSSKYDNLRDIFRPGHADYTFNRKFGIRDHRGGGRSSGRETIGRVAAGALALQILRDRGVTICAWADEVAGIAGTKVEESFIEKNPVRAADPVAAPLMEKAILDAAAAHDSVGGVVRVRISGVPAGLGDPVFAKLDARLAAAVFSLGAVKGFEVGSGFGSAGMKGSEHNDAMNTAGFAGNHAGGILGGISTGADILLRIAVKPTPSIFQPQQTVDLRGEAVEIEIAGRHDPCIVPRIIPVIESMCALVLLDALAIQQHLQHGAGL